MDKRLSMRILGKRIDAHLKRFEADQRINKNSKPDGSGTSDYYMAGAGRRGRFIGVTYVSYQLTTNLTRENAERYLAWLDSGKVGRHYEALEDGK